MFYEIDCTKKELFGVLQLERLSLHQIDIDKPAEKLAVLTVEQLSDEVIDSDDFQLQITKLEEQLNSMKPNIAAIAEYRKKVTSDSCTTKEKQ